jgi:hypothetical protein
VEAMKKNRTVRVLCIADNKCGPDIATQLAARLCGSSKDVVASFRAFELTIPSIHLERNFRDT